MFERLSISKDVISFLSLILFSIICISSIMFSNITHGHLFGNITQVWNDKLSNVKIQFSYLPEKPTADDLVRLQFSIQNLQTGSHLKDVTAKVTVSNDPLYKFDNITVADGDFSLRCPFLDSGIRQVVLKVNSKDSSLALASFNIPIS